MVKSSSGLKKAGHLLLNWAAVIVLVLAVIIFTAMKGKAFFSIATLNNILSSMSIVTIFAMAATVSMAPDGFDMSAATLGTFSAYVFASMCLWFNFPLWLAIIITIIFAMIHQGLGLAYTGGSAVSAGLTAPKWFAAMHGGDNTPLAKGWNAATQAIGKTPWIYIVMIICVIVCWVLLERTKYGRYLYAMGGNKTAAKLSGINVKKMRFMAGMFAAIFIAVGGIVVCSRNSAAQINGSDSYLMSSLAAVFVGRSIGGVERVNALGTAIGALLIATLEIGLTMCGVVYYILPFVKGIVLCLALVAAYATSKED